MAKSKKQKKSQNDNRYVTEGKYERICREHCEHDELEALNRKVAERTAQVEHMLWKQEAEAEKRRREQDRKFMAVGKLIFAIVLSLTIIIALGVLGYLVEFMLPVALVVGGITLLVGTFRAGYLWHEIKV